MKFTWIFLIICLSKLHAQDTSRSRFHAFEGVFQDQQDKDRNIQFIADSDGLHAKILWANAVLWVFPSSDLEFQTREGERATVKFTRDPDGTVNQLTINGGGMWKRNNHYHPPVQNEIPHSPDQLKAYEGIYQFQGDPDRYIQFFEKDNKLVLKQHWDGQEIPFSPDSSWDFFTKDQVLFTLHFTKDSTGMPSKVLVFKRDLWLRAPRANYSGKDLQAFEGKYQLSVDSDDLIQISASGNNLIFKQLWDGKTTTVTPVADLYFYNAAEVFPLKFKKDSQGKITQVLALDGDSFVKVK
jgi:hypothetical protein